MHIIDEAFEKAVDVLRRNVTQRGFSACSIQHDADPRSNYRSVWARDSAITLMWALPLKDQELIQASRKSLETILNAQSHDGHLPNYVDVVSGQAQFGGIGNIAGIDGPMWIIIAAWNYAKFTGDHEFLHQYYDRLHRAMRWLRAHDSNNCGLLEVPEASDWADLFPRSYNVLFDEVLWYRANVDFIEIRRVVGDTLDRYVNRAARIRRLINNQFWPTTETVREQVESFAETQFSLGRTRYLISQITPFGFSWRCDVFSNIIAYLYGIIDDERATSVYHFLRGVAIDQPYPVRVLYPSIRPGEPDWRDYFLVNLQNLPDHYHNGGIWPFVGGLWVRFLNRLHRRKDAEGALESLAKICKEGVEHEWEFNEWAHGVTGRPMGKAYQAWSAASYVAAYLNHQGDTSIEVGHDGPEEAQIAEQEHVPENVAAGRMNLDREPVHSPPPPPIPHS
ncbi:MAG: amylo-alpha-1,6-glucosidase [Planctomycetota bacterium]